MRSDEDDEDCLGSPRRDVAWHLFNDFYSLNKRRVPNIFYFHMKRDEFEQIEGLSDATPPGNDAWALDRQAAKQALEARMRAHYRQSGEFGMRVTVSVFATFVFFLPVIMNWFV